MSARLCPKCETRPSRRQLGGNGTVPWCVECFRAARLVNWKRMRDKKRGVGRPRIEDLTPEQIDARFAAALRQIRRRA